MWAKKLVNLTPHPVTLRVGDKDVTMPPSGQVARVAAREDVVGDLEVEGLRVPVVFRTLGEVEGLPEPEDGTAYLVSALVLEALAKAGTPRADVFAPDTGASAVRDAQGRIVAVTRLVCLKRTA